jgi:hypothetical protein
VDGTTLRMLRDLPDDLRAMGWEFVPGESHPYRTLGSTWFIAVFARPYAPGIDDDRFVGTIQRGYVWISTNRARSASWEDAHRDAIEQMHMLDRLRKQD